MTAPAASALMEGNPVFTTTNRQRSSPDLEELADRGLRMQSLHTEAHSVTTPYLHSQQRVRLPKRLHMLPSLTS